jgi:hypothetical protein
MFLKTGGNIDLFFGGKIAKNRQKLPKIGKNA